MDAAWIGVVGAVSGGLVGVLGTWLAQQSVRSEANRAARRGAYTDFLEYANRGIRTVQTLRRYRGWLDAANDAHDAGESVGRLPTADALASVADEANNFINGLDRALALVQLVAPVRLLEAARHLHDGIYYYDDDDVSADDLSDRFKKFVALAHADLRFAWPVHRALKLDDPIGVPLRREMRVETES